ncbi:MAG: glycosyltransferase family 2 protein [Patescibacteria group bacterium]
MTATPDISIIILNYKTRGLLRQCLRGIATSNDAVSKQVIVVDNASGDGSIEMVEKDFPDVTLVASPVNNGFSSGMNLGLKRAHGRYVALLNTDIAIMDKPFDRLVQFLDQHPSVGLAGPKLINPDGSVQYSCCRFPEKLTPLYRRTPLGKIPFIRKKLQRFVMADFTHNENRTVDWLLGAFVVARAAAVEKVGLLDERFFLYFEDVDWSRRFWAAGWQVMYVADVDVVHYHKRQSAENPGLTGLFSFPTNIHIQSWFRYLAKYNGVPLPIHPQRTEP